MDTPIKEKLGQTMDGKCVLVTGVTGFVGKVIMEKLLYEFPNIKRIYVMIRGKKANPPRTPRGLSATERFQADVLASEIWGIRMRKAGEDDETFKARIMAKVKAIEGSLGGERCSISAHDWKTLCRELDTIIHCAASVNFNDHLQEQVKTNVTGASELIKLLEGPKVKAGQEDGANATPRTFVHVSTCYVGFPKGASNKAIKAGADGRVEEGPCVFPYDPEELLRELLDSPREAVSERQKRLLSDAGHRNTYTFSKAMAETLLTARCNANPGALARWPAPSRWHPAAG
jgi:fatty acyl-CoA reductase|eukprot:COSAG01_NODE_554_length_15534_cov_101.167541_9_plen_288_part_00